MLAYQHDFGTSCVPALFTDCADFGSLLEYRTIWRARENACHRAYGISEATLWTLFRDMVRALDHLHNERGFIHRDIKPDNILAACPEGYTGKLIPAIPIFKLCDFSRAVAYPSTHHDDDDEEEEQQQHSWAGTL